jgi:hypothetical protein
MGLGGFRKEVAFEFFLVAVVIGGTIQMIIWFFKGWSSGILFSQIL